MSEFFSGTTAVREGWLLGDAARWFFPITVTSADTLRRTEALLAEPDLNPTLRRVLVVDRDPEAG